ncbi:MAG: dephospho-CoA kinase [Candidatus Cloacimonadota bacterium]|nr:MAG: dephospho-CoA kinase [Candidatus Cloacimonadota bacterium]
MKTNFAIGLTGGICTGKSAVEKYLSKYFKVIDVDKTVHHLYQTNKSLIESIGLNFGSRVVCKNTIDRKLLGQIVFKDSDKLKILVDLVHPEVTKFLLKEISACRQKKYICIFSIPLLFENSWQKSLDQTLLITCDEKTQLERIKLRDNKTEEEAKQVISYQMPQFKKLEKADYFIENNSSLNDLFKKVEKTLQKMKLSVE